MNGETKEELSAAISYSEIDNIAKTIKCDINNNTTSLENISQKAKQIISKYKQTPQKNVTDKMIELIYNIFLFPKDNDSILIGLKWWFLFALLQKKSLSLSEIYNLEFAEHTNTQLQKVNISAIETVDAFLKKNNIEVSRNAGRQCAEISYRYFHELRRLLIDNAQGKIYISGETLGNAFSATNKGNAPIIRNLLSAIQTQRINEINIYIMDPSVFASQNFSEPIDTLNTGIMSLIRQLKISLQHNNCNLRIHFLPFLDIDHAVITDSFMLFRSTKLWTNEKDHKGSVMLYYKYNIDTEQSSINYDKELYDPGEYNAHRRYLDTISNNSVLIDTTKECKFHSKLSRDLHVHYDIRNAVYNLKKIGNHSIYLYKLYSSQLKQLAISSFAIDKSRFVFDFNDTITCREDLFNPKNLLDDNTQKVLLPYIKKTENLLNSVIKKYDKRQESGAIVIPSLDLGYPNNVMRLAGGFATGMLIDWECGTPIIPVDATVNVCSSSVFKLQITDVYFDDFKEFIKNIFANAVSECGYSFSFDSGNHFLMFATDESGEYYLILHSSAKEMKESYFGLYPKEGNWYHSKIKKYEDNNRYLRYIKGNEAEYFIQTAHHLEKYNEEIHKWLAKTINANKEPMQSIIKHHYYMPTDSSIAIGTFAELPGELVPLFSDVFKPIYLFRIGENNWTYNLGGRKGAVCIIPHGWGQQIEAITNVNPYNKKLYYNLINNQHISYDIVSTARIDNNIDLNINAQYKKKIRTFNDGYEFLKCGSKYLQGKIEKILTLQYIYCKSYIGKVPKEKK